MGRCARIDGAGPMNARSICILIEKGLIAVERGKVKVAA